MQQLMIRDGDLVLGPGGFKMVDGADRVYQDVTLGLVEPLGTDRFHPRWGSSLVSFIGVARTPMVDMQVQSEVIRVINNYALAQRNILEEEMDEGITRRRSVEVIDEIGDVIVEGYLDRLYISVVITTAAGVHVRLNSVVAS